MTTKLKTALQLAQQRVIAPTYKFFNVDEIWEKSSIPDFVTDWGPPDSDDDDGIVFVDSPEYMYRDVSFTAQEQNLKEVNMQQPEKIVFGSNPEVKLSGDFTSYTSQGRAARTIAFELSSRNIVVKPETQTYREDVNQTTIHWIDKLKDQKIGGKAPWINLSKNGKMNPYGGKKILYYGFDHQNPEIDSESIDEIWVPSNWHKQMLGPLNIPISVIPYGINVENYKSGLEPLKFPELKKFVFISVFDWTARKGFDVLLKAYMNEFSDSDDVSLLMISKPPPFYDISIVQKDFQYIRESVDKLDCELPHIELYTKLVKEWEMPRIYAAGNAYVLISRGESFGYTYCEAASCGLPVIASYCSAQMDYLTEENSYLVHPTGKTKLPRLAHINPDDYAGKEFATFDATAINKLQKIMRDVCENHTLAKSKADKLKKAVSRYTWQESIDKIYNRLLEVQK